MTEIHAFDPDGTPSPGAQIALDAATADLATKGEVSAQIGDATGGLASEAYVDNATSALPQQSEVVKRASSKVLAGQGAAPGLEDYDIGASGTVVALGSDAMANMTAVKKSIAIGRRALGTGTISQDNIAIGDDALHKTSAATVDYSQSNPGGSRNIGIGGNALRFNENGAAHVAVGRNAAQNVVGGTGVVAVGNGAHASSCPVGLSGTVENWAPLERDATADINVTAVGAWSLSRNASADNTAFGSHALRSATVSEKSVAVGTNSLRRLDEATWINGGGYTEVNLSGTYSQTGKTLTVNGVTGHGAVAGDTVLVQLLNGPVATFQGDKPPAKVASVTASSVDLISPVSMTGSGDAVLVAVISQTAATAHPYNTAVGANTLSFLRSGGSNVAMGFQAGLNLDGAQRNVALGTEAMKGASGADSVENTAVGHQTLTSVQSGGNYNTAVGWRAGYNVTTAKMSTFLGYGAGRKTPTGTDVTGVVNSTAIGNDARVAGNNEVQLGNSDTTTYVYGTVQNRSDLRDKADVRDTELGLEFIEALRPVDYRWDMRDDYENGERDGSKKRSRFHHGVIAQEVQALDVDFGGLQDHSVNGGDDVLTVGYDEFVAPLIKAVQELSARVRELEA